MKPDTAKHLKTVTLSELKNQRGALIGTSAWITINQGMIDDFARVTNDLAFIHTDPIRAASTRFGGTIAHGLLILSLLPSMMRNATPLIAYKKMGVNYGYERVRFLTPVPVNQRVRGKFTMGEIVERSPGFHLLNYDVEVELEGVAKPALSAQWQLGVWLDS